MRPERAVIKLKIAAIDSRRLILLSFVKISPLLRRLLSHSCGRNTSNNATICHRNKAGIEIYAFLRLATV